LTTEGEGSSALYSGKSEGLLEFLEYLKAKGVLAGNTADAYKYACSRVLAIDGPDWMSTDVRGLDVELQMDRYIRLRGASAKPASLTTYRQRVEAAIELYRTFLDNPAGFRSPATKHRSRPTSGRPAGVRGADRSEKPETTRRNEERSERAAPADPGVNLVTYPFPLRSGVMVYFQLPRDLPASEAKRMCAFLESLAIDPIDESPDRGQR
jgi:hypothetical protein